MIGVRPKPPNDQVEVPNIMRALEPKVFDTVWAAIEALLPVAPSARVSTRYQVDRNVPHEPALEGTSVQAP